MAGKLSTVAVDSKWGVFGTLAAGARVGHGKAA